jgi:MYXO-CTERM domain-containing protein
MDTVGGGIMRAMVGAAALLLFAAPSAAFDTVFNYQRAGTYTVAGAGTCAVGVRSPLGGGGNHVSVSPTGLGHVGGASDLDIDSGESMSFTSTLGARPGAGYRVLSASNQDGDGLFGESFVEAFVDDFSLGVVATSGVGEIDVAALFGGAQISHFQVNALESIRIGRAQWRLPPGVAVDADVAVGSSYTAASPMLQCGVRVETADGEFDVAASGAGLGIVGGASTRVDAGESLLVSLGEPISPLAYRLVDSTNVGGTSASGDHFVEAFGSNGASLGLRSASDDDANIDLTALYGVPIEAFELIGVSDSFRLDFVRVTPEPASGLGFVAFAALAALAHRRRAQATPSTSP